MGNRVVVAGGINMDVVVRTQHHPRPGETLIGHDLHYFAGGKGANQAVAAHRAGATIELVACLGDDAFGHELAKFLSDSGLGLARVRRMKGASGTALIVVDDRGENTIVVVPGANAGLAFADVEAVSGGPGDVFLVQGEIPLSTCEEFLVRGKHLGAHTVFNAAPAVAYPGALLALPDVIVVNETELAAQFAGEEPAFEEIPAFARRLRTAPTQTVVVTLGAAGVFAVGPTGESRVEGRRVPVIDTTGAGDCFVGAYAARLAAGAAPDAALIWANAAASLSVQRPGAAPSLPTAAEVDALFA
jgi:ribokinase